MNKPLVIRYIVFKVAQEFNRFYGKPLDDKDFFDEKNDFTLQKCLLLPYIITIANGNKNFFLNGIFNNSFFPNLIENDKKVVVGNLDGEDFHVYTAEDLGLTFKENKLIFDFNENEFDFTFEIELEKNEQLHFNINYSIRFFIEKRYKDFPILGEATLKKITSQNSAFEVLFNFFQSRTFTNRELVDSFTQIATESFYFTYYNEKIEEDVDQTNL